MKLHSPHRLLTIASILLFSILLVHPINADSVTINPSWDAWASQNNPTDPGQSLRLDFWIATLGSVEQQTRYFIEFNLSRVPVGATITSATLDMNENGGTFSTSPRTFRIFQMSENITSGNFDDDSTGPYVTWNAQPNSCQVNSNSQTYSGVTTGTDDSFDISEFVKRVYNNSDYLRDTCGSNHNYSGLVIQDNTNIGNNYKAYFSFYDNGPNVSAPMITVTYSFGSNVTNSTIIPQDPNPSYFDNPTSHDFCAEFAGDYSFPDVRAWYSNNGTTKDILKLSTSASVGDTKCFTDNTELNYDQDYYVIFNATNSQGDSVEESVHYIFIGIGNFWEIDLNVYNELTGAPVSEVAIKSSHGSFSLIQDRITIGTIGYYTMGDAWVGYTNSQGALTLYLLPISSVYNIELYHPDYETKFSNFVADGTSMINISLTPKPSSGHFYNTSDPNYSVDVPTDDEFRTDIKSMIKQWGMIILLGLMYVAFTGRR